MADFFTGMGGAIGAGVINNLGSGLFGAISRRQNFRYNEMAAENADRRTRALYSDLYSPAAQLSQLKEAGLSPSLFYGDGGGISGQTGAQGAGANGLQTQFYGLDPLTLAQTQLVNAQIKKTNAETSNINTETKLKEIEVDMKAIDFDLYNVDFNLLSGYIKDGESSLSYFEVAEKCNTYDEFVEYLRKAGAVGQIDTEKGQKTLREIYKSSHSLSSELAVLAQTEIDADFAASITNALKNSNYANLNAKAAITYLRKNIEQNTLDEQQKKAWNDLLNKLGEKGESYKDIAIILGLVVNMFIQRSNFSLSHSTTNTNNAHARKTAHAR